MSSYYWSGFPYDNICEDGIVNETYVGLHSINKTSLTPSEYLTIHQNQTSYKFCEQNLLKKHAFPALSRYQGENQWMTKDQEFITDIFHRLIAWSDPNRPYEFYSLYTDALDILYEDE